MTIRIEPTGDASKIPHIPRKESTEERARKRGAAILDMKSVEGKTPDDPQEDSEKKIKQADELVNLALDLFDIGVSDAGEAFALRKKGSRIALLFRGSRDALRSTLSREYRQAHRKTPSATALADALTALQGEAQEADPVPVHLRVAEHDGIVIDLGRQNGKVISVTPGNWQVLEQSPVIFRRTALTGELPLPEHGDVAVLRDLVNVTNETWPLLLGYIVASFFPNVAHPVLMAGGEQGTGKTTMVSIIGSLIDPSPAPVRSQPHDPESWCMAASGSWFVAVDNVSSISGWWSDCLCKAVTGDGWIRRKLYTDSDLSVLSFRRVVALTSIDAGALRGDLGDRILLADLEPIPASRRRSEADIRTAFSTARPQIFGALVDLLAKVLEVLPEVRMAELPRMADFARILAALDRINGTASLDHYLHQRDRVVREVLEGDPVAGAVQALPDGWGGTASDLLKEITPEGRPPQGWPTLPRSLVVRLKRLRPALRQVGLILHMQTERSSRGRFIRVEKDGNFASFASLPSQALITNGNSSDAKVTQVTQTDFCVTEQSQGIDEDNQILTGSSDANDGSDANSGTTSYDDEESL